jgi:hypothetical protein
VLAPDLYPARAVGAADHNAAFADRRQHGVAVAPREKLTAFLRFPEPVGRVE